jgi:SAM-dependent methyltransferase
MTYYDKHAQTYIEGTVLVDMNDQYDLFLPHLSSGASILDAGCGSGRDSAEFLKLGYRVTAFDASIAMVEAAKSLTGLKVLHLRFQNLEFREEFDGIWASASLLHVPKNELSEVFRRLHRSLKPKGILYASFKDRAEDFVKNTRHFTCFTEKSFTRFIEKLGLFSSVTIHRSTDLRPDREGEQWLNVILIK